MRTYYKTLRRMFKKHLARFLSIVMMVLVSVGFVSGLGSSKDKIGRSISDYYIAQNVSDFIVKSTSDGGFSDDDTEKLRGLFGKADINTGVSFDLRSSDGADRCSTRLYFLDFDNWTVNVPTLINGKKSETPTQIYAEAADKQIDGYCVGDELQLDFKAILTALSAQSGAELPPALLQALDGLQPVTVGVCAIVQSPLTFALDGEPSYNNPQNTAPSIANGTDGLDVLNNILYIPNVLIPTYGEIFQSDAAHMNVPVIADNDMYVAIGDRSKFDALSTEYKDYAKTAREKIKTVLPNTETVTLENNYSFASVMSYAEKVEMIGYVIMAAFLLVTALVVFSTMARLTEEERAQIACLKTLGYSSMTIMSEYLIFALIATSIGGVGAYFVGVGITRLIYSVFTYNYAMPPISSGAAITFFIIALAVIMAGTLGATAITGGKMLRETPAELLRPKPPKAGEKVILERIKGLWKRIPFKLKSTFRNVLRYKVRFFMTTISVAFSTALVLAGLALLDLCLSDNFGSAAIIGTAVVIVVFAGLLTAVIIYTLTNINVSERNREIATLMVLGYHDNEVTGYIYREVYINTAIGIVLGYPLSLLIMRLLFYTMGFGTIDGVGVFVWLTAPVIVLAFTWLVTIVLRRKIVKTDMNMSLKTLE